MTPQAVAWHRTHIAVWSKRADERRAEGTRLGRNIALGLDMVVRDMLAALGADGAEAPMPATALVAQVDDQVAHLEARLAACQPCLYPGTTIVMGNGPIMDAVRHNLSVKIATLRGEAPPIAPAPVLPPVILPPAEALPFKAGPQLDLFGGVA